MRLVRLSLLPVSLLAWAIGLAEANTTILGNYGLPANLPPAFYAGLILLIISAGLELGQAELSRLRLGLHTGLLALMLYGTAGFAYAEPRYAWFYKTAGVIQYVTVNGHLTAGIDIYQSWPGFFALAAWFDRVAGVSTPVDYAKWAQLAFELAALPLLYSIYSSLSLSVRQRWMGLMLYLAGNWIAQDYLSPQALSTVLSLGIMAIVCRWFVAGNGLGHLSRDDEDPAERPSLEREGLTKLKRRGSIPFIAAFLLLVFVLVFTHELSPYIITIELAALAVVGQLRPRWIPLAVAAITLGYLLPNFSYVNNHYGLLSSIGSFFSNVQSPSSYEYGTTPESQHIIGDCADLLSVGIWGLALIGAWGRRKFRRTVIALLFLTFSPVLVLVGGAYGGEGILRVYLFSLPWAAALAASALIPSQSPLRGAANRSAGRAGRHGVRTSVGTGSNRSRFETPFMPSGLGRPAVLGKLDRGTLRAPVALAVAAALFLPAFYGNDSSNVMSASEVATTAAFLESAKPGMILCPTANGSASSAKYNQFPNGVIFGAYGVLDADPTKTNIADYLARTVVNYTNGNAPGYVLITPSMVADNVAYGYFPPNDMTMLLDSLRGSKYWKPIFNTDGTVVYEITPAADDIPTGPYNANPLLTIP
jgi:hypothetical protein